MSDNGLSANGAAASPDDIARGVDADITVSRVWLSGGSDAAAGARAAIDLITVDKFDELSRDDLRLMVSELVANSVVHGGAAGSEDSIDLVVTLSPTTLRVECSDPLGGFDRGAPPADPTRRQGFGLAIIGALAARWGTRWGPAGSTWFEFERANGFPRELPRQLH